MASELLTSDFRLMAAPLQGYTEAPFRHFHAAIYPTAPSLTFFSPFLRIEKGEVRRRDLRDITSPFNANHRLIPQIIFRDPDEFTTLVRAVIAAGHSHIDLNLGCPFPPQVHRGRGSGLLARPDILSELIGPMSEYASAGIKFSVKMRLGIDSPDEWRLILPTLNAMPLTHVTVHPRTASQQYSGPLSLDRFAALAEALTHPVIFNGDLTTPGAIDSLRQRFPAIAGAMLGRGLLMRPSLPSELAEGSEWPREKRIAALLDLHRSILGHYAEILCGDAQILSKIRPLWDYFAADFDRKAVKPILKAKSLTAYTSAVSHLD